VTMVARGYLGQSVWTSGRPAWSAGQPAYVRGG